MPVAWPTGRVYFPNDNMAKQVNTHDSDIRRLAASVSEAAGFDVTSGRDCEVLKRELDLFDPRFGVSVSTLKRFFGLVQSGGGYSQSTLNAFARYCGHRSFTDWKAQWGRREEASTDAAKPASRPAPRAIHQAGVDRREVLRWIEANKNPKAFQPTLREFRALQYGLVGMYERGSLDMSLWFEVKRYPHLKHFLVEKFPPMDHMATFGTPMVEDFLTSAKHPVQQMFGNTVLATGMVAMDIPWGDVVQTLGRQCPIRPTIHPYATAMNLGVWLLALKEHDEGGKEYDKLKKKLLATGKKAHEIWPIWFNQTGYFQYILSEWAVLAGDLDLVEAMDSLIETFRRSQDYYHRNQHTETVLDLRQMWNAIVRGDLSRARMFEQRIQFELFRNVDTRMLGMWYHGALQVLDPDGARLHVANFDHVLSLTQYHGLGRRILSLVAALRK